MKGLICKYVLKGRQCFDTWCYEQPSYRTTLFWCPITCFCIYANSLPFLKVDLVIHYDLLFFTFWRFIWCNKCIRHVLLLGNIAGDLCFLTCFHVNKGLTQSLQSLAWSFPFLFVSSSIPDFHNLIISIYSAWIESRWGHVWQTVSMRHKPPSTYTCQEKSLDCLWMDVSGAPWAHY